MSAQRPLFGCSLLFAVISPAFGQAVPAQSAPAQAYQFPSSKQRFHSYLYNAFGVPSLVAISALAGIDQAYNLPPDWGQGAAGYGSRLGSRFGQAVIGSTTSYGIAEVLRNDTTYYKCECTGIGPRAAHALISGFTARTRSGRTVPAISTFAGAYAAGFISVPGWYPSRFGSKDSFRIGNYGLIARPAVNLLREFFPKIL